MEMDINIGLSNRNWIFCCFVILGILDLLAIWPISKPIPYDIAYTYIYVLFYRLHKL
jgi:hypothetical protein